MFGGIISAIKNIVPKGTVFGDILGSTREKGSGIMGIHIGDKKFKERFQTGMMSPTVTTVSQTPAKPAGQNVFITGLLILLAGFLIFTTIK